MKLAIKLRKFGRICPITGYNEQSIRIGAPVIVETDRGQEFGYIVSFPKNFPDSISKDVRLKKVLRYATDDDLKVAEDLDKKEKESFKISSLKAKEYQLPIKIINTEYVFDLKRVVLYYKKEDEKIKSLNTKDFVKDLSKEFNARVEMKEINPRDEAKILGGLGLCGRELCCTTWLAKPKQITAKMVKDLGLPISPTKTTGICGRLLCCLDYEKRE